MLGKSENIFRKKALERLSSPERLDQLMRVAGAKDGLLLATVGGMVVLAFIWSLIGSVSSVATGDGILVAPAGAANAAADLIALSYLPIEDGRRVRPGMTIRIIPETVDSERFGGIVGRVVSVSALPVTRDEALAAFGHQEIMTPRMPQGAYLEVRSELERDTSINGYRWSSPGGPPIKIAAGLRYTAHVTLESRAPIAYVMPLLRPAPGRDP